MFESTLLPAASYISHHIQKINACDKRANIIPRDEQKKTLFGSHYIYIYILVFHMAFVANKHRDSWWNIGQTKEQVFRVIYAWLELIMDVVWYWKDKTWSFLFVRNDEKSRVKRQLDQASTYEQWEELAYKLDSLLGNDIWRQNPMSRKYDYHLISSRLKELVNARESDNIDGLMDRLRSGLLRNIGSIGSSKLYVRAYSGTKLLIEDYINEVIQCLEFIERKRKINQQKSIYGNDSNMGNGEKSLAQTTQERQKQITFFNDTWQSFGSTGLILHGGSLFGLCHIGVIKGLYTQGLLPRIISGSTVGALVAALVCSCQDHELMETLNYVSRSLPPLKPGYTDIDYHSVAEGVLSSLCPPEIIIFEQYVKELLGDMTFEEAYLRTDRILNITVTPRHKPTDPTISKEDGVGKETPPPQIPTLLNYLSAPNVVIWSAAQASIGTGVIHKDIQLKVKDRKGNIKPYYEGKADFDPANQTIYSNEREAPYTRLSELFNVNNFIVSVARPYFAPILLSEFKHRGYQNLSIRIIKLLRLEIQHRLMQLARFNLVPPTIRQWFVDGNIPSGFQVTIVPELPSLVRDFLKIFDSHNIQDKVDYWINVGERSVWPMLSIIWARCAIEFVLDDVYNRKKKDYGF